jgi:UDP-glucose 4-epimerase
MACVQISKSSDIPHIDLETNAVSILNILEYLKNNKTSLKRFVYTSSCSIYGQSEILPITETFSPNISSIYAATKYLGENYTNLYHKLYKIPISIIRYSNVYGPGQTPEKKVCGVIGKFIYETLNDIPIVVYGNGEHKRDYSYIDDVIESTYIISKTEKTLGETYNISSNTNYSVNDIVKIIKSNLYQTKVNFKPPRIIDNINNRLISFDKLNRDTGWAPIHSIENGIEKTIQYFKIKMKKNK